MHLYFSVFRSILPRTFVLLTAICFILLSGCPPRNNQPEEISQKNSGPLRPLKLVVIDDLQLSESIQRAWQARDAGKIDIQNITSQKLAETEKLGSDIVIYPSSMMGELIQRELIIPVPKNVLTGSQLQRRDILQLSRQREVEWGKQVYAVPLGSPMLILYYRTDIFSHLKLQPPTTWTKYQQLANRLSQRELLGELAPQSDKAWHGTIEPLGPGWASQLFLARAASYARERGRYSTLFDYRSMIPMIDGPAFVRALQEIVETSKHSPPAAKKWNPHDVRREFYAGRCAMALSWPSRAALINDEQVAITSSGIAELPGSEKVYGVSNQQWASRPAGDRLQIPLVGISGRLGSVTSESANSRSALILLLWLAAKERGSDISSYSQETTLFRASHLAKVDQWVEPSLSRTAIQQYTRVVQSTQNSPTWLFSVRIAGRQQYLAALDEAVYQAIEGKSEPAEALHNAVAKWESITDRLGRQKQSEAYQRSLGLEP